MTDRSVRVTLRANVRDFNLQIKSAATSLEDLVRKGDRTGTVAATGLGRLAQRAHLMGAEMTTVGAAAASFGAGLLALSGAAITTSARFDEAMSAVSAATHETADNMALLRDAAIEAGSRTAFSASEAAGGIEELGKAGLSTQDILAGGLSGALDLAAAGGVSVAASAEVTAAALSQFGLAGDQATHVADLLAAGAGKAQGGVLDLGAALSNVGVVAASMGISIEETTAALALFASNGLVGAEAGTALKSMLNQLRSPSREAQQTMESLGIAAYDAHGDFVGLESIAGQLRDTMGGLSQEQRDAALSTIFGSYAINAATQLYQGGAEAVAEWTAAVDDQGYAAETAGTRLDNLRGDLEALGGSVETLLIHMGESGQGPLRNLVQNTTDVVNALDSMGPVAQTALLAVTGVSGAALTAGGAFLILVPRIAETKVAMETLGISLKDVRISARGARLGMVGLLAGVVAAGAAMKESGVSATEARNRLLQMAQGADVASTAFQGFDLAAYSLEEFQSNLHDVSDPGLWDGIQIGLASIADSFAATFGVDTRSDFQRMKDDLEGFGDALAELPTDKAAEGFLQLAEMTDGSDAALIDLINAMPAYRQALIEVATSAGLAADDTTLLALATGDLDPAALAAAEGAGTAAVAIAEVGQEATTSAERIEGLVDALSRFGSLFLDAREAARSYRDAVASAWDELAEGTGTADDMEAALDGIASAALRLADALAEDAAKDNFVSPEEVAAVSAALQQGRDDVITFAESLGMSREEAEALADQMGLIPDEVQINVEADVSPAEAEVEAIGRHMQAVAGLPGTITIDADSYEAQRELAQAIGIIDNSDGTVTILGDDGPVIATRDSVKAEIDKTTGDVTISALDQASGTITTVRTNLDSLTDRTVTITAHYYTTEWRSTVESYHRENRAYGGAIHGPGTGTSDSIPAMLSNGEHVWTAAEVQAVGGQARVYELRALARAGMLSRTALGFSQGGSPSAPARVPAVVPAAAGAPVASLTVMIDNPLTGEQIRHEMSSVADGRIVHAGRLSR